MPIVDDVLNGLQIQIDTLWYNLLFSLAGMGWSLERAFLMMGYTIELMNQWLVDHAFAPLIAQTNASLQMAVSLAFVVALLVLGITYLLAAFARMRIVEPKSAIAWYLAGALFFALGPQLYQGMSDFRRDLASAFYASSLSGLSAASGSAFTSLNSVSSSDLGLLPLCDNFGSYLPVWNYSHRRAGRGAGLSARRWHRPDGLSLHPARSRLPDSSCRSSHRVVDGGHRPLGMAASGVVLRQYPRSGLLPVHDRPATLGLDHDGLRGGGAAADGLAAHSVRRDRAARLSAADHRSGLDLHLLRRGDPVRLLQENRSHRPLHRRSVDRTDHPDGGHRPHSVAGRDLLSGGDDQRQWHRRPRRRVDLPDLHGDRLCSPA